MNRPQRKANIKKFLTKNDCNVQNIPQIPENNRRLLRSAKSREGQDCNAKIDHEVEVVASNEEKSAHAHPLKRRMNLTNFIFKSKSDIPTYLMKTERDSDDFETPVKKIKRAPKLSQQPMVTANSNTRTTNNAKKKKRQQKITTAFLRNEQMFSEVVAQHSSAENFNPDEVQLALALSRSELETQISNECSALKEKVDDCKESTPASVEEDIRSKLKKFGFRTANKEDYTHCFAAAFLNGQKRTKTKWGNRFTALTLRDPKTQAKKVCSYIEEIVGQRNRKTVLSSQDQEIKFEPYQLQRPMLSQHAVVDQNAQILRNMDYISTTHQLERFFVNELFPVTKVPPGHLLKDWKIIPGRDLSPDRQCKQLSAQARKYKKFYEELELYASNGIKDAADNEEENRTEPISSKELDELLHLIANNENDNEVEKKDLEQKLKTIKSPKPMEYMKGIPRNSISPRVEGKNDSEGQYLSQIQSLARVEHVDFILTSSVEATQSVRTQQQHISQELDIENSPHSDMEQDSTVDRLEIALLSSSGTFRNTQPLKGPTSPDLFADTDSDDGAVEENNANNITTYEVYSSDDVKTSSEAGWKTNLLSVKADVIVDLTQDAEVKISNSKKHNISKRLDFLDFTNKCSDLQEDVTVPLSHEESEEAQGAKTVNEIILKNLSKSLSVEDMPHTHTLRSLDLSISDDDRRRHRNGLANNKRDAILQRNKSVASIDLTQSDLDENDEDDDNVCILLSDDEVNYSILKASVATCADNFDNSFNEELLNQIEGSKSPKIGRHNFSVLDLIDVEHSFQDNNEQNDEILTKNCSFNLSSDMEPIKEEFLTAQYQAMMDNPKTPTKLHTVSNILKQQRAEFGILESQSEPFSQTPPHWMRTPAKASVTPQKITTPPSSSSSLSLSLSSSSYALQPQWHSRHSNSHKKFQSFLFDDPKTPKRNEATATAAATEYDEFDEFDRLVYGSPPKRNEMIARSDVPAGLSQLLTAEISFDGLAITKSNETQSPASLILKALTPKKTTTATTSTTANQEEITINNHVYNVRITSSPKPIFATQTDAELLKQLYNFGIKPLKRNQATKLLEYIYNETHPIIDAMACNDCQNKTEDVADNIREGSSVVVCSESDVVISKRSHTKATRSASVVKKFNFKDCFGDPLLRFAMELSAELPSDEEIYIFQTNVTKKTQQPLLPLHVAWFNLVCSNSELHESIVMYEPIDLQEIYLFFKRLGYRYDPKDLKSFFDRRCIIFRYDLTPPDKQVNRHIRKVKNKKFTNGTQKCAKSQRTLEKYLSL